MYERSSQALFLKPTVVTLVYGLGIGAVLVLILVPALVVVQRDIARLLTAWRRGLGLRRRGPAPGLSAIVAVASLAGFAWLGVTLGPWLLEGALAGPAARLAPFLPGWPPGWVALAALAAGMVVLLAAGALAGAILLRRSGAAHGVRAG